MSQKVIFITSSHDIKKDTFTEFEERLKQSYQNQENFALETQIQSLICNGSETDVQNNLKKANLSGTRYLIVHPAMGIDPLYRYLKYFAKYVDAGILSITRYGALSISITHITSPYSATNMK
jgi:hypothetical protein